MHNLTNLIGKTKKYKEMAHKKQKEVDKLLNLIENTNGRNGSQDPYVNVAPDIYVKNDNGSRGKVKYLKRRDKKSY